MKVVKKFVLSHSFQFLSVIQTQKQTCMQASITHKDTQIFP